MANALSVKIPQASAPPAANPAAERLAPTVRGRVIEKPGDFVVAPQGNDVGDDFGVTARAPNDDFP
jgi:hypothetical protein